MIINIQYIYNNSVVSSGTKTNDGSDCTPKSGNKKIKFKKAKKLKRITSIASSSYMKHMHDLEGSRFQVTIACLLSRLSIFIPKELD